MGAKENAHRLDRYRELNHYDNIARQAKGNIIAGVDEAGRGPLAGPVVAAACILPKTAV